MHKQVDLLAWVYKSTDHDLADTTIGLIKWARCSGIAFLIILTV